MKEYRGFYAKAILVSMPAIAGGAAMPLSVFTHRRFHNKEKLTEKFLFFKVEFMRNAFEK